MFESSLSWILISLLILRLLSNAVIIILDKSILLSSKITMKGLLLIAYLSLLQLYLISLAKGISIYGGLFYVTTFKENIVVTILSIIVLLLRNYFNLNLVRYWIFNPLTPFIFVIIILKLIVSLMFKPFLFIPSLIIIILLNILSSYLKLT